MSQPEGSSSSSKKRKTAGSSNTDDALSSSSSSPTYSADFNDPEGDVVLQSSDDVLYRVHKFYLQAASTVFRDTLALPQPPSNQSSSSPPVVKLEDSSFDLHHFLHAVSGLSPLPVGDPSALAALRSVLALTNKYGAENLGRNASYTFSRVLLEEEFVLHTSHVRDI